MGLSDIKPDDAPGKKDASGKKGASGRKDAPAVTGSGEDGLHAGFLDGAFDIHESILAKEADDPEHEAFCDGIAHQLPVKAERTPVIDMSTWLSLNADAVEAIKAYGDDVVVEFTCQDKRYSCSIPAGFDFTKCTLNDNTVCVLCVAEAVGYVSIPPRVCATFGRIEQRLLRE